MTPLVTLMWVASIVTAGVIGIRKGYPVWGFFLGLVLSWIGVIIVALVRPKHAEMVRREAERLRVQREAADLAERK